MDSERPEILPVDTEREILLGRLIDAMAPGRLGLSEDLAEAMAEEWDVVAGAVIHEALRRLRVMSARQLAVLLAAEADRHRRYVVEEPPRYTDGEIADAGG